MGFDSNLSAHILHVHNSSMKEKTAENVVKAYLFWYTSPQSLEV